MFLDAALLYDPAARGCDLAFDGTDLQLETTPATALLIAIGSDRRAHPDDALPDVVTDTYAPSRLNARRGWCGDALDVGGRLIGSRLWLLERRKQNEPTRLLAESAAAEATAWFETTRQMPVTLTVRWVARGILGLLVQLGQARMSLNLPVSP